MAKPFETWTVLPHGPMEKVSANMWRVAGKFPGAPFPRTMIVVRLGDGRLVIHSAIALTEPDMKEIEGWGTPAFLIVPNAGHRMDAKIFKKRYPDLRVVGPRGAKAKIDEVVKMDLTDAEVDFGDPDVRYELVGGTGEGEGMLTVRSGAQTTLVLNDVLMNVQTLPGFGGFMMGLFGLTGPKPRVTLPSRMFIMKDKKALRTQLEKLAETPGLTRLEVAHGDPVTSEVAAALRDAASAL